MRPRPAALALLPLLGACSPPHRAEVEPTALPEGLAAALEIDGLSAHFTDPGERVGDEADTDIDDALIGLINGAQSSVDLSAYELDHAGVIAALLDAWDRGVDLRLSTDGDELDEPGPVALRAAGVPVVARRAGDAIQHQKAAVIDGRYVWAGSTNMTESCLLRNDNDALVLDSPAFAAALSAELDQHHAGTFGRRKVDSGGARSTAIGQHAMSWHFSPQHDPVSAAVDRIDAAEHSLAFALFSFTHPDLRDALLRAHARGVEVVGVFDSSQAGGSYSVDEALAAAGVPVAIDGNRNQTGAGGGKLHHKMLIVDPWGPSPAVITGSMNWSRAGSDDNDELMMILDGSAAVPAYLDALCRALDLSTPHPDGPQELPSPCEVPTGRLILNEVLPGAQGFVELVNLGPGPVDLTGWSLDGGRGPLGGAGVVAVGAAVAVPARVGGRVGLRAPSGREVDAVDLSALPRGWSWTRAVDGDPAARWIPHPKAPGAAGTQSPGRRADGGRFEGSAAAFALVINEAMPDPAGDDDGQEYVEIVNLGPDPAVLRGITLRDARGARHRCGAPTLPVGEAVVLWDGPPPGGPGHREAASTGDLSLNNDAEQVELWSPEGALLDAIAWASAPAGVAWTRAEEADPEAALVRHDTVDAGGAPGSPGAPAAGRGW